MKASRARCLAGASLALAASACCVTPPPADQFFDRSENPLETLRGFVYAVVTRQWDYAYGSLTHSSREKIGSQLRFEIAIKYLDDPVLKVPIFDLISSSVRHHGGWQTDGDRDGAHGWMRVLPRVRDEKGTLTFREIDLAFLKEEGEWRLDLIGSIEAMQAGAGAPEITRG
jgi:hypothetical protein